MSTELIPVERIETKILLLRGQKVMLDRDLAALYGVPTGNLKRAVQVNIAIMRAFVRLRHILASRADLARKRDELLYDPLDFVILQRLFYAYEDNL